MLLPLILAAGLALPLQAAAQAQCPLPHVVVGVAVDATRLDLKIAKSGLRQIEREVAPRLAELAAGAAPYVCWSAAAPSPGTTAGRLLLRVTDGRAGQAGAVVLSYSVDVGAGEDNLGDGRLPDEALYAPHSLPDNDPPIVVRDVLAKAGEQFANESFRRRLHEFFLCDVAIARRVEARSPYVRVEFAEALLQGGRDDTRLRLRFRPAENADLGHGDLKKADDCLLDEPGVRTDVLDFRFDDLAAQGWHSELPGLLDQSMKRDDLWVAVCAYRRDTCAWSGGIARRQRPLDLPESCRACAKRR
jgi:hypothetical protein